jgi:hypothetical protein
MSGDKVLAPRGKAGVVPHLRCAECRIRTYVHRPAEPWEDICPRCHGTLQPAAGLEGLVGFQSVTLVPDTADEDGAAALAQAVALPRPADDLSSQGR